MTQTGDLTRRLAVARGDEPADLVVRGGRVLSVFTREWLDADVAICDGVVAGLGSYEGARDPRRGRRLRRAGLHRRPHASRDLEAAPVRVRAPRAAARDDRRRRRPARDRERARHRRRPLARRRVRRPAARRLLHRVVVRARVAVRVAAPPVHARRSREPAAPAARDRARGDDELPRRDRRRRERAGEARRRAATITSTGTPRACSGATCRRTPPPASAPTTRRTRPRRGASGSGPGCGC